MKLDGETLLHIVERDKKFSAACFMNRESTICTWEEFLHIWVVSYIGYNDIIAKGKGPQFINGEWNILPNAACIKKNHLELRDTMN